MLAALGVQSLSEQTGRLFGDRNNWREGIAVVFALIFAAGSFGLMFAPSMTQLENYREKPPATIQRLAWRARYYRDLAGKFSFPDYEATVLEMDIGAVSLYSRLNVLDIGRLCDVPYARIMAHRERIRAFANDYVLTERRPEFMHLRGSYGRKYGVLESPLFEKLYMPLPDSPAFGYRRSENYIRKDLIFSASTNLKSESVQFDTGVTLKDLRLFPDAASPGQQVRIRLFWSRNITELLPDLIFRILIEDRSGNMLPGPWYCPVMGLLPTNRWPQDQVVSEWAGVEIPHDLPEGAYRIHIALAHWNSTIPIERQATKATLIVNAQEAKARQKAWQSQAVEAAARGDVQEAIQALKNGVYYYRLSEPPNNLEKVLKRIHQEAFAVAKNKLSSQGAKGAADILVPLRKVDPRDEQVNSILWRLSKASQSEGEKAQKTGDWNTAYDHFARAVRLQPQNAWARRGAEEVRWKRYGPSQDQ